MALSKKSIDKLRAVKDEILAEPAMYSQNDPPNYAAEQGGCGYPCCIAGWAAWLDAKSKSAYLREVFEVSGEVLLERHCGLTSDQSLWLFYSNASTADEGAALIERFIAEGSRP